MVKYSKLTLNIILLFKLDCNFTFSQLNLKTNNVESSLIVMFLIKIIFQLLDKVFINVSLLQIINKLINLHF